MDSYNKLVSYFSEGGRGRAKHKVSMATGVIDGQKWQLAAALSKELRQNIVVITYSELRVNEIVKDLTFFGLPALPFPAKDLFAQFSDIVLGSGERQRLHALWRMIESPMPLVLSIESLITPITPRGKMEGSMFSLNQGMEVNLTKLAESLVFMGYARVDTVITHGQFSIRGGILDVFSPVYNEPHRIELWGDEIDSIRNIDIESQRSVDNIDSLCIFPCSELVYDEQGLQRAIKSISDEYQKSLTALEQAAMTDEARNLKEHVGHDLERLEHEKGFLGVFRYFNHFYGGIGDDTASLLSYLPKNTLLIFDEPQRVQETAAMQFDEHTRFISSRIEAGKSLPSSAYIYARYEDIVRLKHNALLFLTLPRQIREFTPSHIVHFEAKSSSVFKNRVDLLKEDLGFLKHQKYTTVILTGSEIRAQRLCQELTDEGLSCSYIEDLSDISLSSGIYLHKGAISAGFEYPLIKLSLISYIDNMEENRPRKRRRKKGAAIESFTELAIGDYVVHDNHGIGVYEGIEQISIDDVLRDYLKICYYGGAAVYLAINQLDSLQK